MKRSNFAADSYCGAYAVWHLLRNYGNPVPIDTLVEQMGIRQKGYSTLQDIAEVCGLYGISVQAMHIPAEKASLLKQPFVQYRLPANGQALGHFVLCIPQEDKVLVLDGPNEPKLVDLAILSQDGNGIWDGTILLIQTKRQDYLEKIVSEQISWQTAIHGAYAWFINDTDSSLDLEKISAYYAELSEQQMQALKGGCVNYVCMPGSDTCREVVRCKYSSQCPVSAPICTDTTREYQCMRTSSADSCEYLPAHLCGPKRKLWGVCYNGACAVEPFSILNDYCGTWMRRCR